MALLRSWESPFANWVRVDSSPKFVTSANFSFSPEEDQTHRRIYGATAARGKLWGERAGRFGDDSRPAELRFQHVRVAECDAVPRAKLDKVAVPLFTENRQGEKILHKLRTRRGKMLDCAR